ncbi:MAG: Hsp20/alpha crystallin family protein [Woeseiaceae bacterium]|nr:Hsp20/alpha crystallin family protein [Woeseiaceae bacterium]
MRADLPDACPGEVGITMNAGVLSVSGACATKERREDAQLRHNECISGRFFRQFNLSNTSDADNLE